MGKFYNPLKPENEWKVGTGRRRESAKSKNPSKRRNNVALQSEKDKGLLEGGDTPAKRIFIDHITTDKKISDLMRKEGYAESSAQATVVTKSKEWQNLQEEWNTLMEKYFPDKEIMNMMKEVRQEGKPSVKLDLVKEINHLKDKYPDKKVRVGAMEERDETTKTKPLF